ncbi:hypothetical protein Nepgr_000931 [Nepenthes gracilis]|uniref:Uncharacterized protein n=1 Tax=Nepenthes gracilis TaxID=150966 RepID=A0AAD3P7N3_NEPGR|nr:hypothetical protein Nepgr_000931 [Nepenthes gracilis]
MEKDVVKQTHNNGGTLTSHIIEDSLIRAQSETLQRQPADFVLRWGNRKRLRCTKIQVKDDSARVHKTTVRVDRRVVRADNNGTTTTANPLSIGHFNLRQRPACPAQPPPPIHRVLRNSETAAAMKGQSNGVRGLSSPERAQDKKGNGHNHLIHESNNYNCGRTASSETAQDSKRGGSSSGSDVVPAVWPPKFVIGLTNKEKEEDFMAIKGSKLPQRPKKRAKFIQRTLNLVSPGGWLCDLTLERYEVREKKISKKRPRGIKAMGNMDSDSE